MVSHRRTHCLRPVFSRACLAGITCLLLSSVAAIAADSTLPAPNVPALRDGAAPIDIGELLDMQRHVQAVAKRVIPTTVALRVGQAHGSGVIIDADGYVLTAAHVAGAPNRTAQIRLHDGRLVYGTTLGVYRTKDAGLIKIKGDDATWQFSPMGNSAQLEGGHWCVATGHPGGFQDGRPPVFRLGRVLKREDDAITTDCTLIGGDSGGPLFDMQGRVIGIHSRIGKPLVQNLHVPVNAYRTTWKRLVSGDAWGQLPGEDQAFEPFIGVHGIEGSNVARVASVYDNSPAQLAGILPGDVIIRVGRQRVTTFESLQNLIKQHQPGEVVSVKVLRDDAIMDLTLKVGKRQTRIQ